MLFVTFGDLHLDAPYSGLNKAAAAAKRSRSRQLLKDIADIAAKNSADALICSGDLFDTDKPFLDTVKLAADIFASIDVPVYITPGNHDPYSPSSLWTSVEWSKNVHIFTDVRPELIETDSFMICGTATTEKRRSVNAFEGFVFPRGGKPKIAVFHGEIGSNGAHHFSTEDALRRTGADFVTLGHIHVGFSRVCGNTLILMNVSPEALDFSETGFHGVTFATPDSDNRFSLTRRQLYGGAEVKAVEITDRLSSAGQLASDAIVQAGSCKKENTMLDITLFGSGQADSGEITEFLSDFFAVRINDMRQKNTGSRDDRLLPSLFMRKMEQLYETSPDGSEKLIERAAELGLEAIDASSGRRQFMPGGKR